MLNLTMAQFACLLNQALSYTDIYGFRAEPVSSSSISLADRERHRLCEPSNTAAGFKEASSFLCRQESQFTFTYQPCVHEILQASMIDASC